MAALREGRTSSSGLANGGSTPRAATPRGATPHANGRGGPAVADSVQQALLYVRFRTAAEPGLKGGFMHVPLPLFTHILVHCDMPGLVDMHSFADRSCLVGC